MPKNFALFKECENTIQNAVWHGRSVRVCGCYHRSPHPRIVPTIIPLHGVLRAIARLWQMKRNHRGHKEVVPYYPRPLCAFCKNLGVHCATLFVYFYHRNRKTIAAFIIPIRDVTTEALVQLQQ